MERNYTKKSKNIKSLLNKYDRLRNSRKDREFIQYQEYIQQYEVELLDSGAIWTLRDKIESVILTLAGLVTIYVILNYCF